MNRLIKIAFAGAVLTCTHVQAGTFFVTSDDDTLIKVTDDAVAVFATGLSHPRGMAEDRAGNLYVAVGL